MQGKVIEFWQAVEMFSPPAISVARPLQWVFDVGPGDPLPWQADHPLTRVSAAAGRGEVDSALHRYLRSDADVEVGETSRVR